MISLLVQALYNIIDGVCVAQYDRTGMTVVSLIFPIQHSVVAIGNGIGAGTCIVISRLLEQGQTDQAKQYFYHGILTALVSWMVAVTIGWQ